MAQTQFDKDIALDPAGEGSYRIDIADTWNVNVGPNGGYIAAIMLNGMKLELGESGHQTRSITLHYLSASTPGPASLRVSVEKRGRTLSTATANLIQGDRTIAMAIATFAGTQDSFEFSDITAPVVTAPDDIDASRRMNPDMPGHVQFRDHYDQRLAIGPTPPATSTEGRVGGWTRFREHRAFDDLAIVAISDSWYPSIQAKELPRPMHAPTIDHTVHFTHSVPLDTMAIDDFLLVAFETRIAQDGYLVEDGCIWAPDGTLLARSRQLAILMDY